MKFKKIIINILISFITIYILFGLYLFVCQKSMIYYPDNQDFQNCNGFKDYQKINYNGTRFYYKFGSFDNVIINYHGNTGSACERSYYKSTFEQPNSSIIFVEYSGYSNDNKKPSKRLILKDVQNIHNFIKENSFKNVIVYGESIGSGAASYQTYLGDVDSLILVTPFSRLEDVVQSKYIIYPTSIILTEKYDNIEWLHNFKGRIIIFHGDNDFVIPHRFSQKLFDEIPTENKEYVLIEGKGHNNIWTSEVFGNKLIDFIKGARN